MTPMTPMTTHRLLRSRRSDRTRRVSVRILAVTLLASVLASFALAQATAEALGFMGPVASVKEYQTYEPGTEEPRLRQEWTFSADGVLERRVYYSYSFMDGSLNYRAVSEYADGSVQTAENLDPDGNVVGRTENERDAQGRTVRSTTFDESGAETRRTEWIYDGAGNLAARETYRDGELIDRDEYEYDGQGRRIAARETDGDGNLTSETTYTVPDLEYEVVEYDDDGQVEERSYFVYGEHGVVSVEAYTPDGTLDNSTSFEYDENGLVLKRTDYVTYESMGETRESESTTVYDYEFDDQGNWIRKTALEDRGSGATPIELTTRTFTYR